MKFEIIFADKQLGGDGMKVFILAVSLAGENYNIAGISEHGEWVRPISDGVTAPFWDADHLSFDQGFGFIQVGDIVEFQEIIPNNYRSEYNTEDIIVEAGNIILVKRTTNADLITVLNDINESQQAFENTVQGIGRSLCVVRTSRLRYYVAQDPEGFPDPRLALTNFDYHLLNPIVQASNFTVNDCKWRNLVLDDALDNRMNYHQIFIVFDIVSTANATFDPQIIGVHTDPEVDLPNTYPD